MRAVTVNATDFSRGLSGYLNQVQYHGQVLDIERGRRVVARLSPAPTSAPTSAPRDETSGGYPIAALAALLKLGPHLAASESAAFAVDLDAGRKQSNRAARLRDPWAK